jgi:DoxX-like family
MFVATVVVSAVLAVAMAGAGLRKLTHRPDVVQAYARVGVPEDRLNHLALILLAGAAGLLAGLFWAPVGIAAAAGTVCYFLLAVAAHVRANDTSNLPTPMVMALLAAAALTLRLVTL